MIPHILCLSYHEMRSGTWQQSLICDEHSSASTSAPAGVSVSVVETQAMTKKFSRSI